MNLEMNKSNPTVISINSMNKGHTVSNKKSEKLVKNVPMNVTNHNTNHLTSKATQTYSNKKEKTTFPKRITFNITRPR